MTTSNYFKHEIKFLDDEIGTKIEIIHCRNLKSQKSYLSSVNAKQPGTGKSTNLINNINENNKLENKKKILVVLPTHELAEEMGKKIENKKYFVILKGLKPGCMNYDKDDEIRKMYENEVPTAAICSFKKCKGNCHYRNQFSIYKKKGISVLMPKEMLHVIDFNDFDEIYIDERVEGTFLIEWDQVKIIKQITKLWNHPKVKPDFLNSLKEAVRNKDIGTLSSLSDEFIKKANEYNLLVGTNGKSVSSVMDRACKLRFSNLIMFLEFEKETGETKYYKSIIHYQHLLFYKQLDAGCKIEYLCASFPQEIFLNRLKKFEKLFPAYKGYVVICSTNITNKGVIIYKHGDSGFYKNHIENQIESSKSRILKVIKREKYNRGKKVCILTYKKLVNNKKKFFGCDVIWFGASHGINKFAEYDVIIVIGTYMLNMDAYIEYYLENMEDECLPDFSDFTKEDGILKPKDPKLRKFYEELIENDVYDSVHRLRPLQKRKDGADVVIHWFGNNISQRLLDEFTLKEIE
ncbi:hypothetical protein [Methanolobus psychrotolerans]|uniref:hypothetical protein n=1 Tax=Methanolobus psychrotolerans TaxID=1874706 RepID=UPI000B9169C0|nr:hypothetical protein [Methanolobus psychrotolerans]